MKLLFRFNCFIYKNAQNIHPSIHPSIHSLVSQSVRPSIHPSIHLYIYPTIYLSIYPSIYPSINRSINHSINQSILPPLLPSNYRPVLKRPIPTTKTQRNTQKSCTPTFPVYEGKERGSEGYSPVCRHWSTGSIHTSIPIGTCGEQSGTGTVFSPSTSCLPCQYHYASLHTDTKFICHDIYINSATVSVVKQHNTSLSLSVNISLWSSG